MNKKIVWVILSIGVLSVALFLFSDYTRAKVYIDGNVRCAMVAYGTRVDSTLQFWVQIENRWLTYYLDHEVFGFDDLGITNVNHQLILLLGDKQVGTYDVLSQKMKCVNDAEKAVSPIEFIWSDANGDVMCAPCLEQKVDETCCQILSAQHIGAKCLWAVENELNKFYHKIKNRSNKNNRN